MTEVKDPIAWTMSAALENVPRGGLELPDVTSLDGAVRAWLILAPEGRSEATLTLDQALIVDGVARKALDGGEIQALADRLPANATWHDLP